MAKTSKRKKYKMAFNKLKHWFCEKMGKINRFLATLMKKKEKDPVYIFPRNEVERTSSLKDTIIPYSKERYN